jgi:quinol monooxygenase YgiN
MAKLTIIAKLTAAEGKADEMGAALDNLIDAADEEPGLEIYSVHQDPNDSAVFHFFEIYADQKAWDAHGKGEAMQKAMGAVGGLLGGAPELNILTPRKAKGLDI